MENGSNSKKPKQGKQILVAVDGSVYSANSLHYLGKLFNNVPSITIHLISIISHKVHDTQRAWIDKKNIKSTLDPSSRLLYEKAEQYMQQAKGILMRNGLNDEQIACNVQMTGQNVAADLLQEAREGLYDALLIGRRGLGMIQEIVMGSVSQTILEKCHDVPIWLIDGVIDSSKFLVPIDGTEPSLMAMDHLAFILKDNLKAEVTLFNAPSLFAHRPEVPSDDVDYAAWSQKKRERNEADSQGLFDAPTKILVENGFSNDRIHHLCSSVGIHTSHQIIQQALAEGFGTIVIGRRPGGVDKGIFGGVTDKVISMADDVALWVVG